MRKSVETKKILKVLPGKGFKLEETTHHTYLRHEHEGKQTGAYTYISRGSALKEYSGDLLASMVRQLKLNKQQDVVDLVECPLDADDYVAVLKKKRDHNVVG